MQPTTEIGVNGILVRMRWMENTFLVSVKFWVIDRQDKEEVCPQRQPTVQNKLVAR